MENKNKFNVITLCGSMKFKEKMMEIEKKLTLEGNIVLAPNYSANYKEEHPIVLEMLFDMYKQKVDMSDTVFVVNVDGYFGDTVLKEIVYAKICKNIKHLIFLEPLSFDEFGRISGHDGLKWRNI